MIVSACSCGNFPTTNTVAEGFETAERGVGEFVTSCRCGKSQPRSSWSARVSVGEWNAAIKAEKRRAA